MPFVKTPDVSDSSVYPQTNDAAEFDGEIDEQLAAKDQVIAVLTERLAQAADQLDRFQRMGMDKSGRITGGTGGGGGSMPRELIEQQQQVNERLIDFLDRWDEAQALDRLVQMDESVEELRVAMTSGKLSLSSGISNGSKSSPALIAPVTAPAAASAPAASGAAKSASAWEEMKAKLIGGTASPASDTKGSGGAASATTPAPLTSAPATSVEQRAAERVAEAVDLGADNETELQEPPAPIPLESAEDLSTLREGIDSRDAYIAYLTSKLRAAVKRATNPIDWPSLNNAPANLVAKLKELETQLQDQLKKADIATSLERAALTRERIRLQQIKQALENEIRRLGRAPAQNPEELEQERLMKMLGQRAKK